MSTRTIIEGSTVYIAGLPTCEECWKGLVQVGVKRVIMPDTNFINERWQRSCTCGYLGMRQVGIEVVTYKDEDLDDSNCGSEPVDCQTEKE